MKKRIIFILATVFLIVVLVYTITKEKKPAIKEISWENQEMNFSRISFFNTQEIKAGMNVPEHWEGRYRLKDQGKTVIIVNIDDPQEEKELFRVRMILKNELSEYVRKDWQELIGKDEIIFVYKLSTVKENDEKFNMMLQESKLVLNSFKIR